MALKEKLEHFLSAFLGGRSEEADFGSTQGADDVGLYAKNLKVDEAAIDMGKTSAYVAMGDRYREGRDLSKSAETAMQWYLKASDQGDAQAQVRLADLFGKGEGVPKSPERALEWLKKAVSVKGPWGAWAEGELASAYRYDTYGFVDLSEARRWYQASLEHGNGWARFEFAR